MLFSEEYRNQNAILHQTNSQYGVGGWKWANEIVRTHNEIGGTILDYGAGKGTLSQVLQGIYIHEYDPAIAGKDEEPKPADLVVCTDVLEHIEPENLDSVLAHLRSLTIKRLFFNIAIRPAMKSLPDGRNTHLIIQDADWWKKKLSVLFSIQEWKVKNGFSVTGVAIPLNQIEIVNTFPALSDEERNENVRINSGKIFKRLSDNQPSHERAAIIACSGPSLNYTYGFIPYQNGDVFTVSATHRFMLDKGIIPLAHIDCDPRERNAVQIGEPDSRVQYWLASCVHPSYVEKLKGFDVSLWHNHNGYASEYVWEIEPDAWMLTGGGSVGLRSICLLYSQGYRTFYIHGMDSSYEDGKEYSGDFHIGPPKKQIMEVFCKGRKFTTCPQMISYAQQFISDLRLWPDAKIYLQGDGLLQEMCK